MPQVIFFSMFFKNVEKICEGLYPLKERFNEMDIEMNSENECQLKRIRKAPLLLNQEESLAEKVKKYFCLFDKSQKMYKQRDVFQKKFYPKLLLFYHVLTTIFSKFEK